MSSLKIDISLSDLEKDFRAIGEETIAEINAVVPIVAEQVYQEAIKRAYEKGKVAGSLFESDLKYEQVAPNVYAIYLEDISLAKKWEDGWESFDMKPGFLKSPNAQTSKEGGKYMNVPLSPTSNSSPASSPSRGVTDMRSAIASVMRDTTVNKRIQQSVNNKGQKVQKTTFSNTKNPDLEGLTQVKVGRSSSYFLFRRVSNKSNPSSWIHPGFNGIHIFPELETLMEEKLNQAMKQVLGG
jgi:hypothetical protein